MSQYIPSTAIIKNKFKKITERVISSQRPIKFRVTECREETATKMATSG
jgi:hypothetical protein